MNQEPGLDRNTLIGIVLITLIMGVWMVYFQPPPPTPAEERPLAADTVEARQPEVQRDRLARTPLDSSFAAAAQGEERLITVENDLYRAVFSTKGATLRSFQLKEYSLAGSDDPVEMVSNPDGALALQFTPPQGRFLDTRAFVYQTPGTEAEALVIQDDPRELVFEVPLLGGALRQVYTFFPESYSIGLRVEQVGTDLLTASGGYELVWDGGIPFAEANVREEAAATGAYARSGGEIEQITLIKEPSGQQRLTGDVDWVAVKDKYFITVLEPQGAVEGAELEGERFGEPGLPEYVEDYAVRLLLPRPGAEPDEFRLYAGPMELERIDDFASGIYDVVDYGFGSFMTRPIAEFVISPLFRLLGTFLPNYGLVIILFAIVIKLLLYPLTKASYKNTARMRELQPKIEAVKEKYPDDPQKQQEAMLKVYRETGVNPVAGCLPMLLQYPIIIALWRYFQNSIVIRQEQFLWAADLSAPDPVLHLPFAIPFYGDFVAGFTTLMGLVMIVQMKVAMPPSTGGTQAKIMMYFLPALLFVIFNQLASGLSLYYLTFNILTIFQQRYINKHVHDAEGVDEQKPGAKKVKPAGRNGRKRGTGGQERSGRRKKVRS